MNYNKIFLSIFFVLTLLLVVQPVSAANWTYNYSTAGYSYDLVNSTQMAPWLYYMIVTNSTAPWDLPILGFSYAILWPFTNGFTGNGIGSGSIFYVIMFGLFILMVYRNSGRVSIPLVIACIVGGAWGMILPESSTPIMVVLICAGAASVLFTWFAKE